MGELPLRKPSPKSLDDEWQLPWGLFSETGKAVGASNRYLVLQGQYESHEAATAGREVFQRFYPDITFIIRHKEASDDIRRFAPGVEVHMPYIAPKPPPPPSTDFDWGGGPLGRRYRRDENTGIDYSREADS